MATLTNAFTILHIPYPEQLNTAVFYINIKPR